MAFEIPKMLYSGKIREITLGSGDKAVTVGGETSYPFYLFEGEMPHPPRIASWCRLVSSLFLAVLTVLPG